MLLASDIGADIAEMLMLIIFGVPLALISTVVFLKWFFKKPQ